MRRAVLAGLGKNLSPTLHIYRYSVYTILVVNLYYLYSIISLKMTTHSGWLGSLHGNVNSSNRKLETNRY